MDRSGGLEERSVSPVDARTVPLDRSETAACPLERADVNGNSPKGTLDIGHDGPNQLPLFLTSFCTFDDNIMRTVVHIVSVKIGRQ